MDIKLSNFYRPPQRCIHICSRSPHTLRHNQIIVKLSRFDRDFDFML